MHHSPASRTSAFLHCDCCTILGCLLLVLVSNSLQDTRVVHVCSLHGDEAHFSWPLPAEAEGKVLVVVDPQGREVLSWIPDCRHLVSVHYADRVRVSCSMESHVTFTLSNVTSADEGNYTCRDMEENGPIIESCGQTLFHMDPVHLEKKCRYIRRNRTVTCSSLDLPVGSQLQLVDEHDREIKTSDGPWMSHTFKSMESGKFTCRLVVGGQICSVSLHFTVPMRHLAQPRLLKSFDAVEGQTTQLECALWADDPWFFLENDIHFHYDWIKDGVQMEGQRGSVLTLHNVTPQDAGTYQCRLHEEGVGGSASVESPAVPLTVLRPPVVSVKRHTERRALIVEKNSAMTLTCTVKIAFPPVPRNGFSWTFSPSDSSPAQQLPETGDTLRLGPLTREDSGLYTCQASNDEVFEGRVTLTPGSDSVNVMVSYLENLQLTPDVEVKEGDSFTLTCSVDSSPTAQLQWMVDGVLHRTVTADVDFYNVVKATRHDKGNYTCRASNNLMMLQESSKVTVTGNTVYNDVTSRSLPRNKDCCSTEVSTPSSGGENCASASSLLVLFATVLLMLLCEGHMAPGVLHAFLYLGERPALLAGASTSGGWWKVPPDMEDSCEYTE